MLLAISWKEFQRKDIRRLIDYFIPLNGTGHCMMCDTREYFKKNLLEKNWTRIKYATQPESIEKISYKKGPMLAQSNGKSQLYNSEGIKDFIQRFIERSY